MLWNKADSKYTTLIACDSESYHEAAADDAAVKWLQRSCIAKNWECVVAAHGTTHQTIDGLNLLKNKHRDVHKPLAEINTITRPRIICTRTQDGMQ